VNPSDLLNCFIVQVIVFSAPSPNVHGARKTIKGDKKRKNTCRKNHIKEKQPRIAVVSMRPLHGSH
jgi:hypothetical protein